MRFATPWVKFFLEQQARQLHVQLSPMVSYILVNMYIATEYDDSFDLIVRKSFFGGNNVE